MLLAATALSGILFAAVVWPLLRRARREAGEMRAAEALGWRPERSLAEGLGCTVEWFRERAATA